MTEQSLCVTEKRTPKGWMYSTVALALRDGGSVVYNPTRLLPPAAHEAILAVGRPQILLAPNHYHHKGLSEFSERYPGVIAVCSEAARPRLTRQTPVPLLGLDRLADRLPTGARLLEPPGTRLGETWLVVDGQDGPVWIVCDAFFNVPRHPRGTIGLFARLFGLSAGLRIGTTWKFVGLRDRARYAEWVLARLHEAPPAVLVPAHGSPAAGPELGARLIALVESRLL
ncbi:hypothetical protein L6V77_21085 [Myxococcota bacterium]|nr:hypothetical protein [Myxococcota bacterium]